MNCADKSTDNINKKNGSTSVYLKKIAEVYDMGNNQLFPGDIVVTMVSTMDRREMKFGVVTNDSKHIRYDDGSGNKVVIKQEKVIRIGISHVHPDFQDFVICMANWERCIATMKSKDIQSKEDKFKQALNESGFDGMYFGGVEDKTNKHYFGSRSELFYNDNRMFCTDNVDEMKKLDKIAEQNEMKIFWQHRRENEYFAHVYPLFGQDVFSEKYAHHSSNIRTEILEKLKGEKDISKTFKEFLDQPNKQDIDVTDDALSTEFSHVLCVKYDRRKTVNIDEDFLESMDSYLQGTYGVEKINKWKKELILGNVGSINIDW